MLRRIETTPSYASRLPDDYVAVVLTKQDLDLLILSTHLCVIDETLEGGSSLRDKMDEMAIHLKKLTEGDKWSES